MRPSSILLCLAITLAGCPSTMPPMLAQPREIVSDGSYAHRASTISFPSDLNKFSRRQILQYDSVGETISVGYELQKPACPLTVNLAVYVAPSHVPFEPLPSIAGEGKAVLIQEHFNAVKKGILETHRGAKLLAEQETTLFQRGGAQRGRRGLFEYEDTIEAQPVRADLYLFILGKWALKYRFIYPTTAEACASAAVNDFLLAFRWPRTP